MSKSTPKILTIEDDHSIRTVLRVSLEANGYFVLEAESATAGLQMAIRESPDAVILDLGLPDKDGRHVILSLRDWSTVPILVLSARDNEADKVGALDAGADDYVTKPFNSMELLARIRVALRHASRNAAPDDPLFHSGVLMVDLSARTVTVAGNPVHLTPTEYKILHILIRHAGKLVTHRQLLKDVWGPDSLHETQYLRVHMANLRAKIERQPAQPKLLLTDPGIGYRLAAE